MDFGRVLEAILEGFWMPESMQKSIEFWMDSRRGSGTILASKMCPKPAPGRRHWGVLGLASGSTCLVCVVVLCGELFWCISLI